MLNRTKKIFISLVLFIFFAKVNVGQNIDSLTMNLQYLKDTSQRIDLCFKIANYYYNVERNSKEAEKFLLEANSLAETQNHISLKIKSNNE